MYCVHMQDVFFSEKNSNLSVATLDRHVICMSHMLYTDVICLFTPIYKQYAFDICNLSVTLFTVPYVATVQTVICIWICTECLRAHFLIMFVSGNLSTSVMSQGFLQFYSSFFDNRTMQLTGRLIVIVLESLSSPSSDHLVFLYPRLLRTNVQLSLSTAAGS